MRSTQYRFRLTRSEWPLIFLAFSFLTLYLVYTVDFLFFTPYPGVVFTAEASGWRVNDANQPDIQVGDVITQIGQLTFDEFFVSRMQVPFAGYDPGDEVLLKLQPGSRTVSLTMPDITLDSYLRRFLSTLWFFPFYLAGTTVLLLMRPRDERWWLMVAFLYLVGLWAMMGPVSNWQVAFSRLLFGAVSWLLMPVTLHLHLVVPQRLFWRTARIGLIGLYATAVLLAILEILAILPRDLTNYGFILAILASSTLLLHRTISRRSAPSERVATRLMLAGIGLAFLPGILLILLPQLLGIVLSGEAAFTISYLAVPILPFFYIYAVYKHQMGSLELRANRLLNQYSFVLIFPPLFLLFLLLGLELIEAPGVRTLYFLVLTSVFAITLPPIYARFQRWVNRLAYGTEYDPNDVIRVFANQIPTARRRETLVEILMREITPTLLIRQSALYLLQDGKGELLYQQGMPDVPPQLDVGVVRRLMRVNGRYLPPRHLSGSFAWVRLTVPMVSLGDTLGIWLFGRRDPDDFYPQGDIDLLQTLANQSASVVENIRLYEAQQQQAERLAHEVTRRTAELREERDRTRAILDSAGEGIFFTDAQGVILYVNSALEEMTGYPVDALLQQTLRLLEPDLPDASDAYADLWSAIGMGRPWHGDIIQQHRDGRLFDVRLTISPMQIAARGDIGFVGVQTDISKLKEVDRLKSTIITNVSHELKTPLANLGLYLQLLEHGKAERRDTYLAVLHRETERLTRLIHNLLDLSQLDSGDIPIRLSATDANVVMRNVVEAYQTQAAARQIDLQLNLSDTELPLVDADQDRLEQVLVNLVVNAITYTQPGGHVVVSSGAMWRVGKPGVYIQVTDTGLGVLPEDMPHLFERFYRGQASRIMQAPGTGLGLAICKQIIDLHGGFLDVDSSLGQGATFTVWLQATNGEISEDQT